MSCIIMRLTYVVEVLSNLFYSLVLVYICHKYPNLAVHSWMIDTYLFPLSGYFELSDYEHFCTFCVDICFHVLVNI